MNLRKIKSEDLIFSNEIEDDRTNTYLNLYAYQKENMILGLSFTFLSFLYYLILKEK